MKRISAALALLLLCAGPAVAQKPPKDGPNNTNLTIKASATTVTFGKSVTFTGVAKNIAGGTAVEVHANPYPYAGFKPTGKTGVVDPTGNYSVSGVVPQLHTQYKVVAKTSPPTESGDTFVKVRLRVSFRVSDSTPRRGARVRFYGSVAPEHDGKPVLIQRFTSAGWRTVSRTTTRDNRTTTSSKYSKRLRIRRRATYRVVVQAVDQDHLDGTSRRRTLRVH